MPSTSYALRFISGKYQGGEFPLSKGREIIIGRSSELDMVLIEDMVSRKHAKIQASDDAIAITDMGSTNGTFVNGEKIRVARLKEGDRILIGTSIIKLVTVDPANTMSEAEAKNQLEKRGQQAQRGSQMSQGMSGSLEVIPLPDLLQLLSTSKRSGVLSLHGQNGHGQIYLRKGQIYYATIDDAYDLPPIKAAYRLLTWEQGSFDLEPPDEKQVLEEIKDSTEGLLMEGMRLLDEFRRIEEQLPPRNAALQIPRPLQAPLAKLKPEQLEVFQIALNGATVQMLLDRSKKSDADTAQLIIELVEKDYLFAK